jgi:glucose-1-phosphate thymidylyltransferase
MSKVNKAIILAGGSGTRLRPLTTILSKQLLPVYDKPMVYYPLSTVMLAGIKDILIISDKNSINQYKQLFDDGSQYGIKISYAYQEKPNGIAESILIGEEFLGNSSFLLILGDNLIYGENLGGIIKKEMININEAKIFAYPVSKPEEYGVIEFDKNNKILSLKEKPKKPKSKLAVIGLYIYPNSAIKMSKKLKKSKRGELEITDLNLMYLKKGKLKGSILGRGYTWLDLGTQESLIEASLFIKLIQDRTNVSIGCIEEVAINNKWMSYNKLKKFLKLRGNSKYYNYLRERFLEK